MEPESNAAKPGSDSTVAEIASILNGMADESTDTQETGSGSGDSEAPADNERADSGSGQLDVQEHDATDGVEDDPQAGEGEADSPVNIAALAEHLGVDASDVYELEVPLGDDMDPVSLGELKDAFKEYGPVKEARQANQKQRDDYERMVLATRHELNQVMHLIPENIRGAILQEARDRNQHWQNEQEQTVLEAIPDWADADKRATDRAAIVELGADYGFSESEMTFTQDARTLRLLRDMAGYRRELEEMRTAAKREPGRANKPGKPAPTQTKSRKLRAAISRAKAQPTHNNQVAAVSQLLRQ